MAISERCRDPSLPLISFPIVLLLLGTVSVSCIFKLSLLGISVLPPEPRPISQFEDFGSQSQHLHLGLTPVIAKPKNRSDASSACSFTELLSPPSWVLPHIHQLLIVSTLLTCGDIEINPGPVNYKFPCGRCSKPVRKNQKGIFCEGCKQWFHISCVELSTVSYDRLSTSNDDWLCPTCCLPPLSDSFFDPPDTSLLDQTSLDDSSSTNLHPNINISLFFANVRSIKNKLKDLELLLSNNHSIFGFVETWLDETVHDSEIFPQEYIVFRNDRVS